MAITLTGTGGVFSRWGTMLSQMNDILALAGSRELPTTDVSGSMTTRQTLMFNQFLTNEQADVAPIYPQFAAWQQVGATFISQLSQAAQIFFIDQANRQLVPPLTQLSFIQAMNRLITQMNASGDSIAGPTVSATIAGVAGNNGNPVISVSLTGPDGVQLRQVYAETIVATCTNDAQSGSATLNSEVFTAAGQVASKTGSQGWDWPKGSGSSVAITLAAPSISQSTTGNLLNNSNFESFTGALPANWTSPLGSAQISDGTTQAYSGSHCIKFTGDGATLTALQQQTNNSNGTTSNLTVQNVVALNAWVKVSSVPAAGRLRFALVDGNGTVINNQAGTANQFTVDCTKLSGYQALYQLPGAAKVSGEPFFQLPNVLPTTGIYLKISLTTALSGGSNLFIDDVSLCRPVQPYTRGPYLAGFPGNTQTLLNDQLQITVNNNGVGRFFWGLERLFGLRINNLQIPNVNTGSQTISDGLVA